MVRLACVDVLEFALQIIIRRHKDWQKLPVAVISADSPQGQIIQINSRAREAGIRIGLGYVSALSLCPPLRASTLSTQELAKETDKICNLLSSFSPDVEPDTEPGVFWLNALGLENIYDTTLAYAEAIRHSLQISGFHSKVAVGFSKFGTLAMARLSSNTKGSNKKGSGIMAAASPEEEFALSQKVSLHKLGMPLKALQDMKNLGIHTVAQLLQLPEDAVKERLGAEPHRILMLARGALFNPLIPKKTPIPVQATAQLDFPDTDSTRLIFLVKRLLGLLLKDAASKHEAISTLEISLKLDHAKNRTTQICPAEPTLDEAQLIDLARHKFENLTLVAGVVEMVLTAQTQEATSGQLMLFADKTSRDQESANLALARLRASFGENSVVKAHLTNGHLPMAQFAWKPFTGISRPNIKPVAHRTLVRRIYHAPMPMNAKPVRSPLGVHLMGLDQAPVQEVIGPYKISGGWWVKQVERDYYFAKTKHGFVLWVYYDRRRRRWFLQGTVE